MIIQMLLFTERTQKTAIQGLAGKTSNRCQYDKNGWRPSGQPSYFLHKMVHELARSEAPFSCAQIILSPFSCSDPGEHYARIWKSAKLCITPYVHVSSVSSQALPNPCRKVHCWQWPQPNHCHQGVMLLSTYNMYPSYLTSRNMGNCHLHGTIKISPKVVSLGTSFFPL